MAPGRVFTAWGAEKGKKPKNFESRAKLLHMCKQLYTHTAAFFAKFRPASGDPSLGFGGPFRAPGRVFTARGAEKRKKLRKPSQETIKNCNTPVECVYINMCVFFAHSL